MTEILFIISFWGTLRDSCPARGVYKINGEMIRGEYERLIGIKISKSPSWMQKREQVYANCFPYPIRGVVCRGCLL